jgi:thioredoxin reductase (NADPH)
MTKPTILTVDDDPQVSQAISHDLRVRYGSDYSILSATSGAQALAMLAELVLRGRPVALIATDQRMPEMTGIEMLGQARSPAPDAKFLLLTAYADTDVAIKAINDIGLDYYLLKPWDPPAERLYPVIDDLLGDWQQANPQDTGGVRVVGHRWSEGSHEVKTFLARNYVPYQWLDVDKDEEAQQIQELAHAGLDDLPLVLVPDREVLRSPSTVDLAGALGLRTRA